MFVVDGELCESTGVPVFEPGKSAVHAGLHSWWRRQTGRVVRTWRRCRMLAGTWIILLWNGF